MNRFQISSFEPKANLNAKQRPEHAFTNAYLAIDKAGKVICEVRIYETRSRNYACFWAHQVPALCHGSARVDNFQSDVTYQAIASAGFQFGDKDATIRFSKNDTAAALEAVARHIAGDNFLTVIHAHA